MTMEDWSKKLNAFLKFNERQVLYDSGKITAEIAFARHMNGVTINATGKVINILPDDTDNTPHQKFVIEIHSGHTILVSHNLLRAYRIPVKIGDKIEVHGSYVWNRYGGLIHNTHHK